MARTRLDTLLTERGLTESRAQARQWILAGRVRVNGQTLAKAGTAVNPDSLVELTAPPRYVGRGGEKLEAALQAFAIAPNGLVCLDIGASTGGFTDCLLQRGAARVYAVDVGKGQLHWKLANDPRVAIRDRTNARHLKPADFPEQVDLAVADVSFISLTKILPALVSLVKKSGALIALVKPQFEAGRDQVERGGVVRDARARQEALTRIENFAERELGLRKIGSIPSPIRGGRSGNIEYLVGWRQSLAAESES